MAKSQNGWPVATREQQDSQPLIGNVTVPNGVLAGDVATVFRWLARRYHQTVEPLNAGQCWGWFVKPIEGSATISNHASGTAVDFNAPQNPMGTATSRLMTPAQIDACRAIVKAAGGVLRWGGDYTGRPDAMHWEIVGTRAQVAALADQLKGDDMPITTAEYNRIREIVRAEVADAPKQLMAYPVIIPASGGRPERTVDLYTLLRWLDPAQVDTRNQILAAVGQVAGKDFTDEQAIVTGVLAGLDPAVIAAAIPDDLARQVADELAARLAA